MIRGTVSSFREAIIGLRILGTDELALDVTAAIDTGFTDYLTLPADVIRQLQLPAAGSMRVVLADGSEIDLGVFTVRAQWDGITLDVTVLEADGGPLVGMALLYGFAIYMEVIDGGSVEISRLPSPP